MFMYRDHMAYAHVLWYDNFSKIYRIHSPNTVSGVYHSCLWTGVALHKYNGPILDMRCQVNDQGSTISVTLDEKRLTFCRNLLRFAPFLRFVENSHVLLFGMLRFVDISDKT